MYLSKFLSLSALVGLALSACSQAPTPSLPTPPAYMAAPGQAHFQTRVEAIAELPLLDAGVLFVGDSITEGGDWQSYFPETRIANHGVGWDTTDGLYRRLSQITPNDPDKIFLMIGTNNLFYDHHPEDIAAAVETIVQALSQAEPEAAIYLQSVLPREAEATANVEAINAAYARLSDRHDAVTYIDLYSGFVDANGTLRAELTYDGLHLNAAGYQNWANKIRYLVIEE